MPQSIPPGLKKEHVVQALHDLDGGIDHPFGAPTGYELVHGGPTASPFRSRPPQLAAKRKDMARSVPGVEPNVPQPCGRRQHCVKTAHQYANPAHQGRGDHYRGQRRVTDAVVSGPTSTTSPAATRPASSSGQRKDP
jgi:hypothetical protein